MMFGKKLDINAELKKLANPNLTLEQLANMLLYLSDEYDKEHQKTDYSIYWNRNLCELQNIRENTWQSLLEYLSKRQDEIIAQSKYFDEYQNSYYS